MINDKEAQSKALLFKVNNEKISAVPIYIERRETPFYRII